MSRCFLLLFFLLCSEFGQAQSQLVYPELTNENEEKLVEHFKTRLHHLKSIQPTSGLSKEFLNQYKYFLDGSIYNTREPLTIDDLRAAHANIDWNKLSKEGNLPFDDSIFHQKYKDLLLWAKVYENPYLSPRSHFFIANAEKILQNGAPMNHSGHLWKLEDLQKYKDFVNWHGLSWLYNIQWSEEVISVFADSLDIKELSRNSHVPWNEALIDKYKDHVNWYNLSTNKNLEFTTTLLEKYKEKWEWRNVLVKKNVDPIYILENFSEYFTDEGVVTITNFQIEHSDIIAKYFEDALSNFTYHLENETKWSPYFRNQELRDFLIACRTKHIQRAWTIETLSQNPLAIDWEVLSKAKNVDWSISLIEEFTEYWDWDLLSYNKNVKWDLEKVTRFTNKINWKTLDIYSYQVYEKYADKLKSIGRNGPFLQMIITPEYAKNIKNSHYWAAVFLNPINAKNKELLKYYTKEVSTSKNGSYPISVYQNNSTEFIIENIEKAPPPAILEKIISPKVFERIVRKVVLTTNTIDYFRVSARHGYAGLHQFRSKLKRELSTEERRRYPAATKVIEYNPNRGYAIHKGLAQIIYVQDGFFLSKTIVDKIRDLNFPDFIGCTEEVVFKEKGTTGKEYLYYHYTYIGERRNILHYTDFTKTAFQLQKKNVVIEDLNIGYIKNQEEHKKYLQSRKKELGKELPFSEIRDMKLSSKSYVVKPYDFIFFRKKGNNSLYFSKRMLQILTEAETDLFRYNKIDYHEGFFFTTFK